MKFSKKEIKDVKKTIDEWNGKAHTSEPVRSAEDKGMTIFTGPTSQIEAKALEITEEELLDKYIEKSGYGMDMWSPDENYAVSTILDILFPPNPTK